jgi:hypothetical protein
MLWGFDGLLFGEIKIFEKNKTKQNKKNCRKLFSVLSNFILGNNSSRNTQ